MISNPSSPMLALSGDTAYSLRTRNLEECVNARSEQELDSLWGRIKDWFFGTHRVDAKKALFRMLNAETTDALHASFLDMLRFIEPKHRNQLAWLIDEIGRPSFVIGPYEIPSKADWASQVPSESTLSIADMARLLLSLHHDGDFVVRTFRQIGMDRILEIAGNDPRPDQAIDLNADEMLNAQRWYLRYSPLLVNALELIGMHRNDEGGLLAFQLRCEVERVLENENNGDAALIARNAESLMCLATHMFHDREHLKRVAQSVNLSVHSLIRRFGS